MKKNRTFKVLTAFLLTAIMAFGGAGCGSGSGPVNTPAASGNQGTVDISESITPLTPAAGTSRTAPANTSQTIPANVSQSTPANTDPITVVWYPNESANDRESLRNEVGLLIEQATGRTVEHKLTTDYVIAIEALASGAADIGAVMGAVGYIEAKNKNPEVDVLFVNSGASGTLDDAIYYSWLCVDKAKADGYRDGDTFSIANIQGKRMSFVSNSSTSGFLVPTDGILSFFADMALTEDDLVEGGPDAFFDEVLFGGSHQGSAFNLTTGKADVAAFCDSEMVSYAELTEGTANSVGAVYKIRDEAAAPFNTVTGKEFTVIAATPVLNGPFAYNPANLSPEEIRMIQELFTSEEAAANTKFFCPEDTGEFGLYEKTDKECFIAAEDSWYNPIREMGK